MNKTKLIAYSLTTALTLSCFSFPVITANAANNTKAVSSSTNLDGDIITNPWADNYTGADSKNESPTKKGSNNSGSNNSSSNSSSNGSSNGSSSISTSVKNTKVTKITRSKNNKKAKITLKKIKGANGYRIQYSTTKKFTKKKTKTVTSKSNVKTIKKLKATKKYYVRAKAFKTVGNKKYYSKKWSKAKLAKLR